MAPSTPFIVDSSTNPSTIYNGFISKSVDNGVTWSPLAPSAVTGANVSAAAVDPSGTFDAAVYAVGMFTSTNHAQTWMPIGSPIPPFSSPLFGPAITAIIPAAAPGTTTSTLYATVNQTGTSGFVTKLSPDGSSIVYSTYLAVTPPCRAM